MPIQNFSKCWLFSPSRSSSLLPFFSVCALLRGGKGPYLPALFLIVIHWSKEAEMGISVYLISCFLQEG